VVFGLPIIFAHTLLPDVVQRLAETAVGIVIVLLALRILRRWRQGHYHVHQHEHGGMRHRHVHSHDRGPAHAHEHIRPRTPLQAFLIGVTHGVGGSAAVTLLLLASIPSRAWASIALVVFALGTAVSMGIASAVFAWVLEREVLKPRIRILIVPLGVAACAFGILYAAGTWMT
jgi:cytochrome c biogenesis protein CcdA